MKYLIASDIHGSYVNLCKVLEIYKKEKCERLLLLGDVLYHGPRNDLPEDYRPKEIIKVLNGMKDEIICVKGNCEAYVDQMVLEFPILDSCLVADKLNCYLTHGHLINPANPISLPKNSVVLYGHTHIHKIEEVDGVYYLNPGSTSIPKGDLIKSFAIMDGKTITVYDFNMNSLMKLEL